MHLKLLLWMYERDFPQNNNNNNILFLDILSFCYGCVLSGYILGLEKP